MYGVIEDCLKKKKKKQRAAEELEFFLDSETQVSLGFIFNLNSSLAVAINEIKLISIPYEFHYSGDLTGIESSRVQEVQKLESQDVYDLQGRKITGKPAKGIYIKNGKKEKR